MSGLVYLVSENVADDQGDVENGPPLEIEVYKDPVVMFETRGMADEYVQRQPHPNWFDVEEVTSAEKIEDLKSLCPYIKE